LICDELDEGCVTESCLVIHHGHAFEDNLGGHASAICTLLGTFESCEVLGFKASFLGGGTSIWEKYGTYSTTWFSINTTSNVVSEPQGGIITAFLTLGNETGVSCSNCCIVVYFYIYAFVSIIVSTYRNGTSFVHQIICRRECFSLSDMRDDVVMETDVLYSSHSDTDWSEIVDEVVSDFNIV
jgi:hypothetical protein